MICWKCEKEFDGEIFRTTVCKNCGADLHSCYNCKFFEEGAHYDCKETTDDLVKEKDKANFCDFFSAGPNAKCKKSGADKKAQDAKDAFNSLFG